MLFWLELSYRPVSTCYMSSHTQIPEKVVLYVISADYVKLKNCTFVPLTSAGVVCTCVANVVRFVYWTWSPGKSGRQVLPSFILKSIYSSWVWREHLANKLSSQTILFYSVLFHSIPSIIFYAFIFSPFYSNPFYFSPFYFIPFYHTSFYSCSFCSREWRVTKPNMEWVDSRAKG